MNCGIEDGTTFTIKECTPAVRSRVEELWDAYIWHVEQPCLRGAMGTAHMGNCREDAVYLLWTLYTVSVSHPTTLVTCRDRDGDVWAIETSHVLTEEEVDSNPVITLRGGALWLNAKRHAVATAALLDLFDGYPAQAYAANRLIRHAMLPPSLARYFRKNKQHISDLCQRYAALFQTTDSKPALPPFSTSLVSIRMTRLHFCQLLEWGGAAVRKTEGLGQQLVSMAQCVGIDAFSNAVPLSESLGEESSIAWLETADGKEDTDDAAVTAMLSDMTAFFERESAFDGVEDQDVSLDIVSLLSALHKGPAEETPLQPDSTAESPFTTLSRC